ncbi:MAG: hypothetical protein JSS97_07025 [Actinobacteria bacterium]|nr:hypothetical protein [Actinomycetota bacterium]
MSAVVVIVIVLIVVLLPAILFTARRRATAARAAGHASEAGYEDQPVRSHAEASRRAPHRGRP